MLNVSPMSGYPNT